MSFSPEDLHRKLQEHWDTQIGRQLRFTRRIRWFVLVINLFPAAVYLSKTPSVVDYFVGTGHLVVGVGLFWFLTKQYRRTTRDYAALKLRRVSK